MARKFQKQIIPLLRESVNSLVANPIILLPFMTVAFFQMLLLEIIYFSSQFPLVHFFGPIIRRTVGETYLHYPKHLLLLPQWFQITQYFLFIFVSSFLIAVAIEIIKNINNNGKITFPKALRTVFPQYIHICLAAILTFFIFYVLAKLHGLILAKAVQISSTTGIFHVIKTIVLSARPYSNLLIGTLVTTLFAFVLPIIVIERQKVIQAVILNFKYLWGSFWFLFLIILIPMLCYVPVLLLQDNLSTIASGTFQEVRLLSPVISVVVMTLIDAMVYTAITIYFLFKRESA